MIASESYAWRIIAKTPTWAVQQRHLHLTTMKIPGPTTTMSRSNMSVFKIWQTRSIVQKALRHTSTSNTNEMCTSLSFKSAYRNWLIFMVSFARTVKRAKHRVSSPRQLHFLASGPQILHRENCRGVFRWIHRELRAFWSRRWSFRGAPHCLQSRRHVQGGQRDLCSNVGRWFRWQGSYAFQHRFYLFDTPSSDSQIKRHDLDRPALGLLWKCDALITNANAGQISLASAYALIMGCDYLETDTYEDLYLKNLGYGSYEERTANLFLNQEAFAGLEEAAEMSLPFKMWCTTRCSTALLHSLVTTCT